MAGGRLLAVDTRVARDLIRVPRADATPVAQQIRHLPGVRDAYPDRVASIKMSVNDPYYGKEWGLSKIQAGAAWDTSEGVGVKVAVLDCGIHAIHLAAGDHLGAVDVKRDAMATVGGKSMEARGQRADAPTPRRAAA